MKKSQQKASRKRSYWLAEKQKRCWWWDILFRNAKRSYRRFRKYHQHEAACRMAARGFPANQQPGVAKLLQIEFAGRERRIALGWRS